MADKQPGSLTLDERLSAIEKTVERVKHRVDLLLLALALGGAGLSVAPGIEALAHVLP